MYWIKIQISKTTTSCRWIERVAFTYTPEELVVLHIIKIPSSWHHVMFSVCVGQIRCAAAATLRDVRGTSVDCWSSWYQRSAIHIQEACWINNQISSWRVEHNMTPLNRWVHSHVPICFSRFIQWYCNLTRNSICSFASQLRIFHIDDIDSLQIYNYIASIENIQIIKHADTSLTSIDLMAKRHHKSFYDGVLWTCNFRMFCAI